MHTSDGLCQCRFCAVQEHDTPASSTWVVPIPCPLLLTLSRTPPIFTHVLLVLLLLLLLRPHAQDAAFTLETIKLMLESDRSDSHQLAEACLRADAIR